MKQRKTYEKPTCKVMELKTSVALLQTSATLEGYQYQTDGWED